MHKIISISGYAQSGKDTVAKMISLMYPKIKLPDHWSLEHKLTYVTSEYEIVSWADSLRSCAEIITGVPAVVWKDYRIKNSEVPGFNITGREFLQRLGSSVREINQDAWVNSMFRYYTDQYWLIPDTRYRNEADKVRSMNGACVRVVRPGVQPANGHISEVEMDNYPYDAVIINDGSLYDLYKKTRQCIMKLQTCIPH